MVAEVAAVIHAAVDAQCQRIYLWKNKQILLWSRTGEAAEVFSLWRSKRVFSMWSSSKIHASSGEANGYSYVTQASALPQPEQREKKRIIEEKEQKSVMQRVKAKQTKEKKHCNRNHHRQQEPTDPCFIACANPHCNFLVHPDPVLNGFCCRTCAWNFKSGGKYEKKHGRMCKRIRALTGLLNLCFFPKQPCAVGVLTGLLRAMNKQSLPAFVRQLLS